MSGKIDRRNFMKTTLIGSAGVAAGLSLDRKVLAQEDAFNQRVIQDAIYSMHLYRDKLIKDKHRPRYHFVMPEGMAHPFDPNGAIYWKGRYHLFYVFQPYQPVKRHRGDCWAHISSHDLVHWRFHSTALKPGEDDPEVAIYSGNAFLDKNGVPTIIYQGLGAGQCIAKATDDNLDNWKKLRANPVIPYPEFALDNDGAEFRTVLDELPEYGKYDVWDPHAWLDGDTYYCISGDNSGKVKGWPADNSTLWKSKDLENWKLVGDFFHHGETPGVLDCPDFFKLGDKYVLLFLHEGLKYKIGEFKNEQFHPEKQGTMTWQSGVGYAPESLLDHKGRRIMWAALYDSRPVWGDNYYLTRHAWDGVLTLPRILSLDKNNDLLMEPAQELQALRANHIQKTDFTLEDSKLKLSAISGDTVELDITILSQGAKEFGIKVCCSPDGSEETDIIYDSRRKVVCVDLSKTSSDKELMERYEEHGYKQEAKLELKSGESLNFHIFLDRSVMEVFVNNRLALTHRVYPTRDDSQGVAVFAKGGTIKVPRLDAWKMHPSNPW